MMLWKSTQFREPLLMTGEPPLSQWSMRAQISYVDHAIALDPTEERDLLADYPEVYLSLWKKLKEQVEMEDQLQQEPVN